jgi:opacity protein-like surface antigen
MVGASSSSVNSITQGFFLAPHLLGASLQAEDEPTESGGGFGVSLGYGFSRLVSAFLTLDFAKIDIRDPEIEGNYNLGQGDIGLRFSFRDQTQKAIPYAQAAFTGRVAQTTIEGTDIEISGPAFTVGGGLNYYFQPKLALDIGLSYTYGNFDTIKIDGDEVPSDKFNAAGARFQFGLTWFPFASVDNH